MISFAQLEKRTLTTNLPIKDEQSDGTVKTEDFHIVFRDVTVAESKKIITQVTEELEEKTKPLLDLREKIVKAYEDIAELAGKNGDSPKKIKDLEKKIGRWEKDILALPPVPTFQQLHLSKLIVDLPDLRGDNLQEVPSPTIETIQRLPYNLTLAINAKIAERLNQVDEKK